MKLFIFATLIAAAACARLENNYLPPPGAQQSGGGPGLAAPGFGGGRPSGGNGGLGGSGGQQSGGYGGQQSGGYGGQQSGGFGGQQNKPQQGGQQPSGPQGPPIEILSYENENNGDGNYKFSYETANGIKAEEKGEVKNKGSENEIIAVSGSYSYTAPDGQLITVTYIADENGFQPSGDHLPTSPPIPEAILQSLAANAAAQANNPQEYQGGQGGQSNQGNQGYPGGNGSNGGGRPSNQYVPPTQQKPQQQRPNGNGSGNFSPQSGYKY